jgi:2-polyprenyl-6-methoxyphenol hydroxylase-like FAD-dependent oxidoreductase
MGGSVRVSDFYFASDYTYRHLQNAGPRWLLIGDAAGFIDPIFSSGVMFAIKSGYRAASAVLTADRNGRPLEARAQARYTREVGKMCEVFLNMIKMFYNNRSFDVFMTSRPPFGLERAVNNLVAGNTDLGLGLRLRVWMFYAFCTFRRLFAFAPKSNLSTFQQSSLL